MKRVAVILAVLLVSLCLVGNVWADEKEKVVDVCKQAAEAIKADPVAALCEINKKDGKYVDGDLYVFVMNMDGVMMAHPMKPALIGKNLTEFKDQAGKAFFKEFVEVAKDKGSGWVDYKWPKPGEDGIFDKTSYILMVEDSPMFVGAGIYK